MNNAEKLVLENNKKFWLVVFIPLILVVLVVSFVISLTDILSVSYGVMYLSFMALLVYVLITLPAFAVILLVERNSLAKAHNQILNKQVSLDGAQLHTQQFVDFMPADLCKRLGIAPLVLHRLFFPASLDGDLAINQTLLKFIQHGFAELIQAAKVVSELEQSDDEDEQAVKNNRLAFVVEQSVGLMYFVAQQTHGHTPDCKETYFVKDALADYFDLICAVMDFDLTARPQFEIEVVYGLFSDKAHQGWFKRNSHMLAHQCQLCAEQNPFAQHYKKW